MTDEETVDWILDNTEDKFEMYSSRACPNLRAAILKALKDARQPVAYEVPGFTVIDLTYPSWEDVCGSLAPVRPEDVHLIV